MNYSELKESKKHGDEVMPIKNYDIFSPLGITPLDCHWHTEMEFFQLIKGRVRIQKNDEFFEAEPGALLFFSSGELHAADNLTNDSVVFRSIVFHPELLSAQDIIRAKYITPIINGSLSVNRDLRDDRIIVTCFEGLFETLNKKHFGYELEVKALLFTIFARLIQIGKLKEAPAAESSSFKSIKKVTKYINDNYGSPITIDDLAALCNMSQGHFCRLFKQITLKTPVQYINNVRISKASEMLIFSDRKILDIAMDTGFNSLSYFIGVFKESMGITPTNYRKKYRE